VDPQDQSGRSENLVPTGIRSRAHNNISYYVLVLMHFVLHWGIFIHSAPGWSLNPGCHAERIPVGVRDFSLHKNVQTGSEFNQAYFSMGTQFFFPRVKLPEHEVNHSPPSSTKVKNE